MWVKELTMRTIIQILYYTERLLGVRTPTEFV